MEIKYKMTETVNIEYFFDYQYMYLDLDRTSWVLVPVMQYFADVIDSFSDIMTWVITIHNADNYVIVQSKYTTLDNYVLRLSRRAVKYR